VTCTATDSSNNTGQAQFQVTVTPYVPDAPIVTPPPSRVVEANGPDGSRVSYPNATAVDAQDDPDPLPRCTPASGSLFRLGTTVVTCTATDAQGNTGSASFTITVVDTTPPVLTVPSDLFINSTAPVSSSDPQIAQWLESATATDIVDRAPEIDVAVPSQLPLGTTTVTFRARDASGNGTVKSAKVTIGPDVKPPPPGDHTPPGNPRSVKAVTGNRSVTIRWQPPGDADFDHVQITRTQTTTLATPAETVVYTGAKTSFVDSTVKPGNEYRYVIASYDKAGNRSAGVAVVALLRASALLSPQDGAVLHRPPHLSWKPVAGADYYNVQFWRGKVKMLSVWPSKTSFTLPKKWRFAGKVRRFEPGVWKVYAWPGFGKKSAGRYGELIFSATFYVRR
jgi:hypothetical protein